MKPELNGPYIYISIYLCIYVSIYLSIHLCILSAINGSVMVEIQSVMADMQYVILQIQNQVHALIPFPSPFCLKGILGSCGRTNAISLP